MDKSPPEPGTIIKSSLIDGEAEPIIPSCSILPIVSHNVLPSPILRKCIEPSISVIATPELDAVGPPIIGSIKLFLQISSPFSRL